MHALYAAAKQIYCVVIVVINTIIVIIGTEHTSATMIAVRRGDIVPSPSWFKLLIPTSL
jgi:hypothetical protein